MTMQQFTLFPAIDILQGACVRLLKGDYEASTQYNASPANQAGKWLDEGAKWLHVVDLDGAKSGYSVNEQVVSEIVRAAGMSHAHVQVGGGIRTYEAIDRWIQVGVARVIIGTAAENVEWMAGAVERFGQDAIVVGLDGRQGKLAVDGWTKQTETSLDGLGAALHAIGVRHALVTDVDKDGTLSGANLNLASKVQSASGLSVIASGGIRNLDDVLAAKALGLAGAIVGRSLYDGTLNLQEALCAVKEAESC